MLCEHCKKREATVKYVEVINGVKTEHNLCTQCAAHADLGQFSALFEGEFPLGKLLSGLLGTQETEEEDEKYSGVVCPTCGTTYEEFVKDSRFGCPDCYSVFDPLISDNIRHLQGSEKHVGKRPAGYRSEMEEMRGGNYWRGSGEYSGTLKGREDPPDGDEIKRRGAPGRVRGGREAPG